MKPAPKMPHSAVVNWSIAVQLIDQFPAAGVVINCPPFRGTNNRLPPDRTYWPPPLPIPTGRSLTAALGYVVAKPMESITGKKRHRLTATKLGVLPTGDADVLHF
jgi:hypothetical protein